MEFKDAGKRKHKTKNPTGTPDTLYFNAFTEDLFVWENDLEGDSVRRLQLNEKSSFFNAMTELALDETIAQYLSRYADFDFDFTYKDVQQGKETVSKPDFVSFRKGDEANIKVSRGEQNIFIWCVFMAICERMLDGHQSYQGKKYLYIDTLSNDWDILRELNPAKKPSFDAIVANPPFSLRWEPTEAMGDDVRFKNYGLAPKSAADFAFLLHGFHYLKDEGVMAIILPHGVLFRGGAEERIRTKLLKDGHIDTVIGLPANLFYSTGIPVCILILKKCKKPDDVLFINAAEHFAKGKRQNQLTDDHIAKIVDTYQFRKEEERYSKRVSMDRIAEEGFNLNISRYISTAVCEDEIDLSATQSELVQIERQIRDATSRHNGFLKELGLALLPGGE